jgi:ribosomal protein L29
MFPRAVAGEQYARYAKSVWTHAQRWLTSHWVHAARGAASEMDARLKLRALAATDLNRHLNEQEEQLLSEIVQLAWSQGNEEPIDISLDRL